MATTAAYPSTSPTSIYQNQWDHSVPLDDKVGSDAVRFSATSTDRSLYRQNSSGYRGMDDIYSGSTNQASRQTQASQTNSNFRTLHSKRSATNMSGYSGEGRGSEPYSNQGRRPSVQNDGIGVVGRKWSVGSGMNQEDADDSAWIHRDKLAQIESRELAEAGIRVRRPARDGSRPASRSQSRASNKRAQSRDRYADRSLQVAEAPAFPSREEQRPKIAPAVGGAEHEDSDADGTIEHELRTQEEVAAERGPQQQYARNIIRPSTSRIPIAKTSPLPVPPRVLERDSPLPRSRHGSNNFGSPEDGIAYRKTRARSLSLGSQAAFEYSGTPTPPRSRPASSHIQGSPLSPNKARVPDKAGPTSRKSTSIRAASAANRQRPTSGIHKDSPRRRPASSHISRPSASINRPEGEAPWIATMYKPDPRLPQDQQMLPTHAKRMMQEQWEREGKTGDVYDRNFNLLNDRDPSRPNSVSPAPSPPPSPSPSPAPAQTEQPPEPSPKKEQPPWPLQSPKPGSAKETSPARPSMSGGYRITPALSSPQTPQRPMAIGNHSRVTATAQEPIKRVPDVDEKGDGKKNKSFACCIVM